MENALLALVGRPLQPSLSVDIHAAALYASISKYGERSHDSRHAQVPQVQFHLPEAHELSNDVVQHLVATTGKQCFALLLDEKLVRQRRAGEVPPHSAKLTVRSTSQVGRAVLRQLLALSIATQLACLPQVRERCRLLTEPTSTVVLPPGFAEMDALLLHRASEMTLAVRGLRVAPVWSFRVTYAEQTLPVLCTRLERARRLAVERRFAEAGRTYQALLVTTQVLQLSVAMHVMAQQADVRKQPSGQIMQVLEAFGDQMEPIWIAALSEDPDRIKRALNEHPEVFGTWVKYLEQWPVELEAADEKVKAAKLVWNIAFLVVATYEAAGAAAEIAASGRTPMPPLPVFATGGGAAAAGLDQAAYLELAEALKKLIASGALDAGVVLAISTTLPPSRLGLTQMAAERGAAGKAQEAAPSPALKGDPYHPDAVAARLRPQYRANPAHDPRSPLFNPRKAPEPPDAAAVYTKAVRADSGTWYGRGEAGWYRFSSDNAGGAHFSGTVPESQVPAAVLRGQ